MRRIVLAGLALLHVAVLLAWRPPVAQPGSAARETLVYLMAPAPKAAPRQQAAPASKARPAAPVARAVRLPSPAVAEPGPITPEQAPAAVAKADETDGAALLENARKLAGSVDRQLRKEKEALDKVVKPEVDLSERFEQVYNDYSAVPSHERTIQGDRIDRVEGPHGSYCVRTLGNNFTGGRDPFKSAGKQMVVNCPQRGPLSDFFVQRKKKRQP